MYGINTPFEMDRLTYEGNNSSLVLDVLTDKRVIAAIRLRVEGGTEYNKHGMCVEYKNSN